jgi:[ribosomal protein S5]-alanine N-acetyltransferase
MELILETERLILRKIAVADAETMYELNTDPLVIQFTGDGPFESVEATRQFIAERQQQYAIDGYGRWIAQRKEDGAIIGWCGLKFHPETNETDVGYRFFRKFWNRGYGTEACAATIQYGFKQLGLKRIYAEARMENTGSWRIMEKCGMRFSHKSTGCDGETVIYDMLAE